MNEDQIREIAREEATRVFNMNFSDGTVGPHQHDGADNLKIDPRSIGFYQLPQSPGKVTYDYRTNSNGVISDNVTEATYGFASSNQLAPLTITAGPVTHIQQYVPNNFVTIAPIPIVVGNGVGVQSAFNGGAAPDGSMVAFLTGSTTTSFLYVRFAGAWYGVNLSASIVTP